MPSVRYSRVCDVYSSFLKRVIGSGRTTSVGRLTPRAVCGIPMSPGPTRFSKEKGWWDCAHPHSTHSREYYQEKVLKERNKPVPPPNKEELLRQARKHLIPSYSSL